MTEQNTAVGIRLMILTTFVFSIQDAVSRHLAAEYNTVMVIMIRYWFFAAFVIAIAARSAGGVRAAAATGQLALQIFRGVLLAAQVCLMVLSFVLLGLVEAHAVFACYPLLIAALAGPVLGEKVGWRRWAAIGVGFVGILLILRPGFAVFAPEALVPLAGALAFALYGLLTRYVGRRDSAATSFFWTGIAGVVVLTPPGLWLWEPMDLAGWGWMAFLCVSASFGHFCLIKVYEIAEASAVQPFAYFQLVFASTIGVFILGETLEPMTAIGAAIVVSAGLFTLFRARRRG
ncbi:DMT family transporter [Palleronia sp.]|uniref:DMT family transporter n=1 Tax=Palleronia sp. TaxID=1940284 RepID=UPI0035C7A280